MSDHKGCGCDQCRQPMPDFGSSDVLTSAFKQDAYASSRALWRLQHPHRAVAGEEIRTAKG